MTILVNDECRDISSESTLGDFVRTLGLPSVNGIAVSVNGTVVPRGAWGSRVLAENDRLIVIQAAQGG